ncbi:MAG: anti-sigma factor family protein [Candidatus Promineifilaceae bacterium]|jgi:predicted anti-sigma-YlaC factor YlaD
MELNETKYHKEGSCHHLLGDLSEYLDEEASAEICAEIEQHMDECADCRAVIDTLRKTILLYREMPQPDMPDGVRLRLYKALDLDK